MMTYLPGMERKEQIREKIRKRVRQTSRAQYAVAREKLKGRAATVLVWLAHHYNRTATPPTSGELMAWVANVRGEFLGKTTDYAILYVRRGLSDLQTKVLVESVPEGKRVCAYTGTQCETWRVRSR